MTASLMPEGKAQPSINPHFKPTAPPPPDPVELFAKLRDGDRVALARAITLVESEAAHHRLLAHKLLELSLSVNSSSMRVGITGVPGVGKSTFIEALGSHLVDELGRNVAVLAVDPSSEKTHGSILGDKSRMPNLAASEKAFIRPSPTRGFLSGITRWTQETILLCEAAGFDTILVETVGVGQSETAIKDVVDTYLLLLLPGAGDELQGMKRGVVEMADVLAITKSDGTSVAAAEVAQGAYRSAVHLMPPQATGWTPTVLRCSSVTGEGINEVWDSVMHHRAVLLKGDWLNSQRAGQRAKWFNQEVSLQVLEQIRARLGSDSAHAELLQQVRGGSLAASIAAKILVDLLLAPAPSGG